MNSAPRYVLNTSHHEIDNRLRCVDDSVCIGNLYRKALKKLLVDRVEETLFLGEVVDGRSGAFDCYIERVKATQEILATESVRHQRSNNGLDFTGDDIAAGKFGVAKDGSEDPLGQQVLNQHLLDCGFREVGVD